MVNLTVSELRFRSGSSNKFYRSYVCEDSGTFSVVFHWGRRGAKGQVKVVPAWSLPVAEDIADDQLRRKRYEGYQNVWSSQRLQVPVLHPKASLPEQLSAEWSRHLQRRHAAALSVCQGPVPISTPVVLHLHDFELELSEPVAASLQENLTSFVHVRTPLSISLLMDRSQAELVLTGYSARGHALELPREVDSAVLETFSKLWDPASGGPLSECRAALEATLSFML